MTFSVPSFLAASTSLSTPPKSAADLAVAAAAPLDELSLAGGAPQAASAMANAPTPSKRRTGVGVNESNLPRRACPRAVLARESDTPKRVSWREDWSH